MSVFEVGGVCTHVASCDLSLDQMLRALLEHSGRAKRGSELFETRSALSFTKKFFKGLKVSIMSHDNTCSSTILSLFHSVHLCSTPQDVENVYTRHKPLLADTIDQLAKDRLSEAAYPYCGEYKLADK